MQVLYQIDVTRVEDPAELSDALDEEYDSPEQRHLAVELALAAWAQRADADAAVSVLTPDWPTHRQPPVDRAILRLAYHEIVSGRTPAKVAINEAVELAKHYAAENSPAFINGVLDKFAKSRGESFESAASQAPGANPVTNAGPGSKADADAWLADAVDPGDA